MGNSVNRSAWLENATAETIARAAEQAGGKDKVKPEDLTRIAAEVVNEKYDNRDQRDRGTPRIQMEHLLNSLE